jgi:DNA-binding NarL/FixJ family response regulator
VAVLDGALPGVADGSLITELRQINPRLTVVLLAGAGRATPSSAARAGANSIMPRTASIDEITDTVRHLHSRSHARRATRVGTHRAANGQPRDLSPREKQVLELLRDGHTTPAIAATLQLSMSTAKTYVARLYDKLDVTNRSQALLRAERLGLLEPPN